MANGWQVPSYGMYGQAWNQQGFGVEWVIIFNFFRIFQECRILTFRLIWVKDFKVQGFKLQGNPCVLKVHVQCLPWADGMGWASLICAWWHIPCDGGTKTTQGGKGLGGGLAWYLNVFWILTWGGESEPGYLPTGREGATHRHFSLCSFRIWVGF